MKTRHQKLFDHMEDAHGITLIQDDLNFIALAAKAEDIDPAIERIREQRQRLIDRPYENDYIKGVILGLECALDQLGVKP